MLPAFAVPGIGAVASPVPPVGEVYHNRLSPVAINAVAVSFTQYSTGEPTTGADGIALTITVAVPINATLQFPLVAPVKFKVTLGLTALTVTVAVPFASMVTVPLEVPS